MSAPILWIFLPFLAGGVILFFVSERYSALIGGSLAAMLSLTALLIPIDLALLIGGVSFKISASVSFFGRSFSLGAADGPVLAFIFGVSSVWFFGSYATGVSNRFNALGLMIVSLLTASMAVEPFLFAALMLEIAAMLAIPMLLPHFQKPGRGVIRFLIYQTLAMPFILFAGWMLAGVEASPGDVGSTTQAGIMLGLGFAFLFGVFPLSNWIPTVAEESSPFAIGFLLWALTTFTVIFALGFMDRYVWIRTSESLSRAILFAGAAMVAIAGLFASTQKHLGRIMGYHAIAETGLLLIALGVNSAGQLNMIFLLLIPRGLELAVWALGLTVIRREALSLRFAEVQGFARKFPVATSAIFFAQLSMIGFPLLAGFPARFALWQEMGAQSVALTFWVFIGLLGMLISAIRSLAVFAMAEEFSPWSINESLPHVIMLGVGIGGLFLAGIFPQALQLFMASLPALFEHISQ